jgi:hypothetical protein
MVMDTPVYLSVHGSTPVSLPPKGRQSVALELFGAR